MEIVGLTSQNDLIKYNIKYPSKETCKSFDIKFNQALNIQSISKIIIKPKVDNWKYVNSMTGIKIFLSGYFKIKIFFKQYDNNSMYSTKIKKGYSDIIPISNIDVDSIKPSLFLEDTIVSIPDNNKICLSLLILNCITSKTANLNTKNEINSIENTLIKPEYTFQQIKPDAAKIECDLSTLNLDNINENYDYKQAKPNCINIDLDMSSKTQSIIK